MTRGRWLKVVGVVVGATCLLAILPCVGRVRDTPRWTASQNVLHIVGDAVQLYYDTHHHLPPAAVCDRDGRPLYSWRVLILPYAEQKSLFDQFHLDEPWDSPHNLALARTTPRSFRPYTGWYEDEDGTTRVQAVTGPGSAFEQPGLTWDDFPDGLGNTALLVEVGEPVPWSKPGDVVYDPTGPLPRLGSGAKKPVNFLCYAVGWHPGFAAYFADGKARFVRSATDEHMLRAMFTRNGGEPFDARDLR